MKTPHIVPIQTLIAEYLIQLAGWRRQRYQDDLRDPRNLRSADAIEDLARFVRDLPEADERLTELDRLWRRGEQIEVGQQAAYEIGRFQFFESDTEPEQFIDFVITLARADMASRAASAGHRCPAMNPGIEPSLGDAYFGCSGRRIRHPFQQPRSAKCNGALGMVDLGYDCATAQFKTGCRCPVV